MKKLFQNQKFIKVFRMFRPWLTFSLTLLVLYYASTRADVSSFAYSALLKTGLKDISVSNSNRDEKFNYNFTIRNSAGEVVDVNQFKGKVVFLNLWATWCGPCVAEMPSIQSLYDKVNKDKVVFIMLNWFQQSDKVSTFINTKQYTFPVYYVNGDVPKQLTVPSIPTTFVVSPDGKVVSKKAGTANYDTEEFKTFLESM
jgi:thiol-disulfide isomerase/thioredoxin